MYLHPAKTYILSTIEEGSMGLVIEENAGKEASPMDCFGIRQLQP
jgi:hypothetical protein